MFQDTWAVPDSEDECKVSDENRRVGVRGARKFLTFLHNVKKIIGVVELADRTQCAGFECLWGLEGWAEGSLTKVTLSSGCPVLRRGRRALQHWSKCALERQMWKKPRARADLEDRMAELRSPHCKSLRNCFDLILFNIKFPAFKTTGEIRLKCEKPY